jgi:YebC/PmpR family DNA-binding regulatory protein
VNGFLPFTIYNLPFTIYILNMSGHSKWSKVKHQKAVTDVVKAAAFTKASRGISIAVTEGGGITDPQQNFHLRLAIEKARDVNMPKENIERIIAKAKGGGESQIYSVLYEAYGFGGAAMLIEATTDNKQRTVSAVKNLLEHHGAVLAAPGAVSYLFDRTGVCVIKKSISYEKILEIGLDAGIEDVTEASDYFEIYAPVARLHMLKNTLELGGIEIDNLEIIMKPKNSIDLQGQDLEKLNFLITEIENLDDVSRVYTNTSE